MILLPPYAESDMSLGGKARGLVDLYKAAMPVPDFIVIQEQFFSEGTSEESRQAILRQAWEIMSGWGTLVIRSSMSYEDQDNHACAGIGNTYLNISEYEDFIHRIEGFANAMNTEPLKAYAQKMNIVGHNRLSIILQKQVMPSLSGVMFTCNPLNMDRSHVEIEISHSCATHSVDGRWHERISLDKITRDIRSHELRAEKSALNKDRIDLLLDRAIEIEKNFGKNKDIEWAIVHENDKNVFFYLQMRPVTSLQGKLS